jgi:hypothetical protein
VLPEQSSQAKPVEEVTDERSSPYFEGLQTQTSGQHRRSHDYLRTKKASAAGSRRNRGGKAEGPGWEKSSPGWGPSRRSPAKIFPGVKVGWTNKKGKVSLVGEGFPGVKAGGEGGQKSGGLATGI